VQKYIWQHTTWPKLVWDDQALNSLMIECRQKQSFLLGAANMFGFDLKLQAQGVILEKEVLETSAIVELLLDAGQHFDKRLSEERLKGWHAALFPGRYSGFHLIE